MCLCWSRRPASSPNFAKYGVEPTTSEKETAMRRSKRRTRAADSMVWRRMISVMPSESHRFSKSEGMPRPQLRQFIRQLADSLRQPLQNQIGQRRILVDPAQKVLLVDTEQGGISES